MTVYKTKEKLAAEAPRPEQLFVLAGAVVCLAKDQGKKKASSRADRAHILLPGSLEFYESSNEGDYMHVTHRFIGRIGRVDYRRWSMRLIEPYWINTDEDSHSYRSVYSFEWTKTSVVNAAKKITVSQSADDCEYGLQAVTVDALMFEPDFVNAANQYEAVSGADCDRLIDDVREFGAASIRNLQYSH